MSNSKSFWQLVATVAEAALKQAAMQIMQRDFTEAERQFNALQVERKRLVEEMGFDPDLDYHLDKTNETLIPVKGSTPKKDDE